MGCGRAFSYTHIVFIHQIIRDHFKSLACYKYPDHAISLIKVFQQAESTLEPQFRYPLTCTIRGETTMLVLLNDKFIRSVPEEK